MYLTLNAPDLVRPVYRALAPHLSQPLERRWRLPSKRTGESLPSAVWAQIEAMETEERRQKRLHVLSALELEAIRALRSRQWFGLLEVFEQRDVQAVLLWNGYRGRRGLVAQAARHVGRPVVFFERCAFPGYLQVSLDGTNADSRHLNSDDYSNQPADPDIGPWFKSRQRQRPRRGLGLFKAPPAPLGPLPSRYIYCPLQVAADTQLSVHGAWVRDMPGFVSALVEAARDLPPEVALVFRPHPSCAVGQEAVLKLAQQHSRVLVAEGGTSAELLAGCEALVTVNSSVGLEAFAYDKPVITLGQSFYGREGLSLQATGPDSLRGRLHDLQGQSGFDPLKRAQFLTWLREKGFQGWPRNARDPAAAKLAQWVEGLIRDAAADRA